ncbi:hypothetical protein CROQUDRAFT_89145 [Cronartium quercuum f. sp. fusiforme G11]|uniref:Retrovirus-related Pol polyprotein from transposon TNT 1-94-like beta-barrel domain-containing protein n=1 Tax=Cronartium quercuum f. sp. fusiforme G11 TaxID=708437 RepID=A0A9P6NLM0_9BASI|nr:hypothetical protein CROQUDRAFT_89145 [Cronartium quercuum f. sp. fusiforme G11]
MMIKYSLDTDIAMKISKSVSAADAMGTIKALFYFPSRSKQVACWRKVLAVQLNDNEDIDTCLQTIDKGFDELEQDGFVFTKDSLISLCYELALLAKYSDVTSTLNGVLRAKPAELITANQVEELIHSQKSLMCKDNDQLPTFSNLSLSHTSKQKPGAYHGGYHQQLRINNRSTNSTTGIDICRACGAEGHWAWACPHNPRNTGAGNRYERTGNWRTPSTKGPGTSHNVSCNPEHLVKVNFVDVNGIPFEAEVEGPLPDGIWTSEGSLTAGEDADDIGDMGASHNVTGDVSHLTHFRKLRNPIPIFVATETPTTYITGWGSMTYKSDDGTPICLENVFYCPTAKRTLISIPAILEAGGSWETKGKDMILCFPSGQ